MSSIGVGITTHNRYGMFKDTFDRIKARTPADAKIIVVDDASTEPVKEATFRFTTNVGIATAKNKCLELLEECDHIFLFDDDCYPLVDNWYEVFINHAEPHLCYIFEDFRNQKLNDCSEIYRDKDIIAYSHTRGCLIYIRNVDKGRSILDTVGGMDTRYKRWGYEHVDWSNRIYNAGFTTFRYMDVHGSDKLLYSGDREQSVKTSVPIAERVDYLRQMKPLFDKSFNSTEYCSYKRNDNLADTSVKENVILTAYYANVFDTQRRIAWTPNKKDLDVLINSMNGNRLVILNNCGWNSVDKNIKFEQSMAYINPYFQRWISWYKWLKEHEEVGCVWLVDATDVELLKNPFEKIYDDKLYVGYEPKYLECEWMTIRYKHSMFREFFEKFGQETLLNCGLIGGTRQVVLSFLRDMITCYSDSFGKIGNEDMGMFNYVMYTKWHGRISFGQHVNTEFKKFEKNNKKAIWRHK